MLTLGDPSRPALVLLHGFLGSGRSWLPVARPLSAAYHCILPDLPGHGGNLGGDPGTALSFDLLDRWLEALLAQRGAPVHLAGYSLGGRAALHFACQRPGQVRSLVLESASAGIEGAGERARRLAEDQGRARAILQAGMAAFVDDWYRMPLFASLGERPRRLAGIKAAAKKNDPHWMARVVAELSPGAQPPQWQALGGLSIPVLLLAGEKDGKYVQTTRAMAERIPGARHGVIPGAGHNVHAERPAAVAALIGRFLASQEPTNA